MNWPTIRDAFKQAREARGLTQKQIPGVPQPMISKLELNTNLGPTVGVFVKAVNGLGMPLSAFFLQLESGLQTVEPGKDNPPPVDLSPVVVDDSLPQLASEERIAQRVLRSLTRFALEGVEGVPEKRPTNYRLPPSARPQAAESSRPARKNRAANVPSQKKKRRRK